MTIVWNGEGLPPVGCECEVWCQDHADYEWVKIAVFAEYKGVVIGIVNMPGEIIHDDINKYAAGYNRARFRPIRTEADRKREVICDSIYGAITRAERKENRSDMAEAVYDAIAAGKIPHITLK